MFLNFLRHLGEIIEELFRQEEIWLLIFILGLAGLLVAFLPPFSFIELLIILWPFIAFLILFPLTRSVWLFWRQEIFKRVHFKKVLLELRIPREIKKTPEAMEQVLAVMHSLRNVAGDLNEKYWIGEITRWFSLEVASFGGEIRFYIRVYAKQRDLLEAALFSFYPDLEVVEVEDYVKRLPQNVPELYEQGLDLWSTEVILRKEEAYPIKTYPNFEGDLEERENDPIATFLEVLSKVKPGEFVGVQILIAPGLDEWDKQWEPLVAKLKEPKVKESKGGGDAFSAFARFIPRSPVETDVLKAVEEKLSKSAFKTLVRFIYTSPKEIFYDSFARRGLVGVFKQYSTLHLNGFKNHERVSTRSKVWQWPHLFPRWRNEYKKQRLLWNYIRREVPPETWVGRFITSFLLEWNFKSKRYHLSTEEVATIFHPPSAIVLTEPHISHLEARRKGPPAGLAIFGEEEELERYK
ncbi:MAG: hypothetical protein HY378_00970 [Candidatus Brennerbacteria bacterium]|nr:hypothetical protein [Candidatus Brennerbacteria bacterium]